MPPVWTPGLDLPAARVRPTARPPWPGRARTSPRSSTSTPTGCPAGSTAPRARSTARSCTCTAAASSSTTSTCTTPRARMLANRAGVAVLSVDYRRPPEHRFPAAPDDVDTVLTWLARSAAGPTYVHGDSAGGNLALVAALRHPGRFAALALIYPFLDPTAAFDSYRDRGRRLRPGGGRVVLAAVRRVPGRPDRPRPRAAALRPARHPAADPGRHRRARPAARRGRAPRPAARRGGGAGGRHPLPRARCTASGGTPASSTPRSR